MSAAKHTPGPWNVAVIGVSTEGLEHIALGVSCSKPDEPVCLLSTFDDAAEEDVANALLIAAAPDLLEALEDLIECGMIPISSASDGGASKYSRQVHIADKIRAAIAKAKGGGE